MKRTDTDLIEGKVWYVLVIANIELFIHEYLDKDMDLSIVFIKSESMKDNKGAKYKYFFFWISLFLIKGQ